MSSPHNNLSSLTVNNDAFEIIKSEIASKANSSIPQPVMIIGQEGSGKTALLRRLYRSCQGERCLWIDGRSLFSSDYIVDLCMKNKSTIVFIDDMDYYFSRCSYEEQFRLRRFLYNEDATMLIASVSRLLPSLLEYEAPFFEGLKNVYLNPISNDSLVSIFNSDAERALDMYQLLPPVIKSLLLINCTIKLNADQAEDISVLLSFFSDMFKNIYKGLPAYSQRILNVLDKGMTMPEIREKSGLSTNILTAYLKRLLTLDIVKADRSEKRNTRYSVKDPLFIIWLKSETPIPAGGFPGCLYSDIT